MEKQIDETNKAEQLNLYCFNSENILTLLKEIINDIKDNINLPSSLNLLNDSSPKMRLFPDSIRTEEETSSDDKQDKQYTLNNKFKQLQKEINDEIQSVYKSYLAYEKNIFVKVNALLQEKESLHQLNYVKLVNRMSYLEQIYNDIQKFINFFQKNMQMLKNVLYKIDESLIKVHQPCISVQLIEKKLSTQSELNYMLEYKIIDEIIVVIPDLLNYYTKIIAFNKFNVDNYIPNTNDSNAQENSSEELSHSLNHSLYQELLKEKENSFYKIKKLQQTTTKELRQKDKELNVLIMSDNFRYKFQNLGILIKYRYKYIKSMGMNDLACQGSKSDGFLNPHYDEECLIQKFIPQKSFEQYSSSKRKLKGNIIKSINAFLVQQFIYETICSAYLYWRINVGWGLFVGRILSRLLFGLLLRFEFFHNYRLLVLISFLVYGISSYTIDYITDQETDNINTAKLFLNGLGNPSCVFELFISRYCPRTVFKDKLLQFNNVKYIAMVVGFLLGYGKINDRWFDLGFITVVLFCLQCVALLSIAFIDTYSAKEEQYQNKELSNEELNIVIKAEEHLETQQNFSKNNYIEDNIKEIIQNEKKKMKINYLIFILQLLVIYTIKLDCLVNLLKQNQYSLLLIIVYLLGFVTAVVIERKFLYLQFTMLFIVIISVLGSLCYISSVIIRGYNYELSKLVLLLTLYMFLIISKLMVMKVSFEIPQNLRFCGLNTYLGVSLIRGISFIIAFMYNPAPNFRFIFVFLHALSLLYSYSLCKPKTFMRVAQNYVIG